MRLAPNPDQAEDVDALLQVKDAVRGLADYAMAAHDLAARLEVCLAAAQACRWALAQNPGPAETERVRRMP